MNSRLTSIVVVALLMVGANSRAETCGTQASNELGHRTVELNKPQETVFEVPAEIAGEIVSSHDIAQGQHRLYQADVVTEFFRNRPLTASSISFVAIILTLFLLGSRKSGTGILPVVRKVEN